MSEKDIWYMAVLLTIIMVLNLVFLGGGGMMIIYDQKTKTGHSLIAREAAPLAVVEKFYRDKSNTRSGPLAIAMPGELQGYWALHQKFGRLPWRTIVQPTIEVGGLVHL